jgi:hypothetical protein
MQRNATQRANPVSSNEKLVGKPDDERRAIVRDGCRWSFPLPIK